MKSLIKKLFGAPAQPRKTERGEAIAAAFLEREGLKIIQKNFRSKYGEIDIVCSDGETFCFVEVKSRSDFRHGFPEEFVDRRKREKLTLTALAYIRQNFVQSRPMRFDVVSVDLSKGRVMRFIKQAFEAEF